MPWYTDTDVRQLRRDVDGLTRMLLAVLSTITINYGSQKTSLEDVVMRLDPDLQAWWNARKGLGSRGQENP